MSIRSKGSLWEPSKRPARIACAAVIGSSTKCSSSSEDWKREISPLDASSLPALYLMAISQADTADTRTVTSESLKSPLAFADNFAAPWYHHNTMCVSRRTVVIRCPIPQALLRSWVQKSSDGCESCLCPVRESAAWLV